MAGIYLHIPFCKQACHYCDFHFSTTRKAQPALVEAMLVELELQKEYLNGAELETVYFGGGTPSLLTETELQGLMEQVHALHSVKTDAEITLEANPDDINPDHLRRWKKAGINRLSIGIQSFSDDDLRFMNRAHNGSEAVKCLKMAQDFGFSNLTVDLIYGSPSTSDQQWHENIQVVLNNNIPHISCYALTVEAQTALDHFIKKGKVSPLDEVQAARQFEILMAKLKDAGYEHYEISNFAKDEQYARHNTSYWQGKHYSGIGPSAHSFNGHSRQWNIAHNHKYISALQEGRLDFEREELQAEQQYNEYVLTGLRTKWGCSTSRMGTKFKAYFLAHIQPYLEEGSVQNQENTYTLTNKGKLIADRIAMDLFWEDGEE